MQPIRMGMIGGGEGAFIGAVHRHAAGLDGNYQLVCGAFSRNEENNMRTASALNVSTSRTYGSWQTMLEEEAKLPEQQRMQVVVIFTYLFHLPQLRQAFTSSVKNQQALALQK